MKIEIAKHSRMTESGSSLLRLIQNQDMPLLDLFVRESVQNSLDASQKNAKFIRVDMKVNTFDPDILNKHFEKIESGLNRRYSKKLQHFIAIQDKNTVGLTGPTTYDDVKKNDFGNLLKLVYEICKPQSNEGAGGSWGLGKTIYFRLGIGLVLYYSRIHVFGRYENRLSACLVENETKKDTLLPKNSGVRRGIAWWGQSNPSKPDETIPLQDDEEITDILEIFGLKPYEGKETGTTIIIPYINEKSLLEEVYPKNEATDGKPYWAKHVSDYLNVALQRWYAPRLSNPSYPYGPYLNASVNGAQLKIKSMLPLFRCVRELYILATGGAIDDEALLTENNVVYHNESIALRNVLDKTSAGNFVFAKLTRDQLLMGPPANNKPPYQQITNISDQTDDENGAIIMYTRQPGMIVGYDYDSKWTHHMPKTSSNEYIIGLFVINSPNTLKTIIDPQTNKPMTLEEYIRQGEKADHASWTDRNIDGNNPHIVSSIQKHVINKIKKEYTVKEKDPYIRQNIGLSQALANLLLPAQDFGSKATPPPGKGGGSPGPRTFKASSLRLENEPQYTNGCVKFNFEIRLKKECLLILRVITDFKRYDADTWESNDEIGKPFPLQFKNMNITKISKLIDGKRRSFEHTMTISEKHLSRSDEYISVSFEKSKSYATRSYIRIQPQDNTTIIKGNFSFTFNDPSIAGACDLKELENE